MPAPAPGHRLLVDGMNVVGSRANGWWRDRTAAMATLVGEVDRWAARTGVRATVVLDGDPRPLGAPTALADVVFAPGGRDAADDEIVRRLAAVEPAGIAALTVVTSDGTLELRARELGARVTGVRAFREALADEAIAPATSARDPRVRRTSRLLRGLADDGGHRPEGRVVAVDGQDLVREALGLGADVALVLAEPAIAAGTPFGAAPVVPAGADALRALGAIGQAADVAALVRVPGVPGAGPAAGPVGPRPTGAPPALLAGTLVLCGLRDEGNVGTIVRTTVALGLPGVVLDGRCADPFSRRALRAAMGATFAPGAARTGVDLAELVHLPGRPPLVAAVARGGMPLAALPRDACVVLGSEREGLSPAHVGACDAAVTIATPGFESLNVAAAAAILAARLAGADDA